ncbi:hypothetical protein chiPu_0015652 [Chiloscyllium punctatum]|uniref:Uncharacterized protein n=1 Tax=Chiloscyllium punctatum TaxID=137246 RepID=A0A401T3C1_CHIPU|nr:hypothetical protein [Chiloscyllium punctatum]
MHGRGDLETPFVRGVGRITESSIHRRQALNKLHRENCHSYPIHKDLDITGKVWEGFQSGYKQAGLQTDWLGMEKEDFREPKPITKLRSDGVARLIRIWTFGAFEGLPPIEKKSRIGWRNSTGLAASVERSGPSSRDSGY